jgi:hypothetical protein
MVVENKQRNKRLRLLIKNLNKERKKQAKKIDILCNDLITAQSDLIRRLHTISFAAHFYKSIIGSTDLSKLLNIAGRLIRDEIADASVTFFLRQTNGFETHAYESNKPEVLENDRLESCFNAELVVNICKANKLCTLEDMFALGLQGNLVGLNKISAFAVPLSELGQVPGFVLIHRSSQNKFTTEQMNTVCVITCGLSRAIRSCQMSLQSAD